MRLDIGNYLIYFAAFSVNLISFSVGCAFAWTSPVLPKLKKIIGNPLPEPTTTFEESWITSLISLGACFAPFLAGFMSEKIGRKRTLVCFSGPMILSHVICVFADSVNMFLVARFLLGIGIGGVFSIVPNYMAEISEDSNRGYLGCVMSLMIALGNVFTYAVGPFITIQLLSVLNLIPLLLFILTFGIYVPESPYYFIQLNDKEKAEKSLKYFRNINSNIPRELSIMTKSIVECENRKGSFGELFASKGLTNGLTIVIGLMIFQQFSGINAILGYMENIFQATKTCFSPEFSVIFIGSVQFFTTVVTIQLVDQLGRKILLLISLIGSCLSLSTLSLYFYLSNKNWNMDLIFWLPLASLLSFIVLFNAGLSCIPWVIVGELFPSNIKSLASSIATSSCLILSFFITMFFPHICEDLGMAGSFYVFAVFCAIGSFFTFVFVPETKGKSLVEIQEILNHDGGKVITVNQ